MTDQKFTEEELRVAEEQVANRLGLETNTVYQACKYPTTILHAPLSLTIRLQAQVNAQESELTSLRERVRQLDPRSEPQFLKAPKP